MKNFIYLLLILIIATLRVDAQNGIIGERTNYDYHVNKAWNINDNNIDYILSTPYVDTKYKIYDFADQLSDQEEQQIRKRCEEFIANTNLDIAIVIIDENNKTSYNDLNPSEVYITDFYDYNDFGLNIDNDYSGVMFLIDLQYQRNSIFDAGKAYEQNFMGNNLEEFASEMRPLFDEGKYYEEIMWFIEHTEEEWLYTNAFPIWKIIIISIIITLIWIFYEEDKYKLVFQATQANDYIAENSFHLTTNETKHIDSQISKRYSPPSKSSGGGSSGSSGGGHSGGSF